MPRLPKASEGHCVEGHPLEGPGADVYVTPAGARQCRVCRRVRDTCRSRGYGGEVSEHRARYLSRQEPEEVRFARFLVVAHLPDEWVPSLRSCDRERTPCVLWVGQRAAGGLMGSFRRNDGTIVGAHVYSLEASLSRSVGEGMHVNHVCRVPLCVNPYHLEEVTRQENQDLGLRPRRSHCEEGHELSEDNVVFRSAKDRHRLCRTCREARSGALA